MESTWCLSAYYAAPDDPQIDRDMQLPRASGAAIRSDYEGRIAALAPEALWAAIEALEAHAALIARFEDYAFLLTCTDATAPDAKALLARAQAEGAAARGEVQFFSSELQTISPAGWDALLAAEALAPYHDYLFRQRRLAAHQLPDGEARMALRKDLNGVQAWRALYAQVQATLVVAAGDSLEAAQARMASPDRDARREAQEGILAAVAAQAPVLTEVFNSVMGDVADMATLRGFASPLAANLGEEGLAQPVVEAMLSAVESRYDLVHRYYRSKQQALGLADFATYDLPAPYPGAAPEIPFEQAREWVLAAFAGFSPQMAAHARRFFDERYIDLFPRPRKRGAAFCIWSRNDVHPYILLNYTGAPRDVLTLAHELGHGVHYCAINDVGHSHFNVRDSVFAETPSTFAELLLVRHLAQAAPDPTLKLQMLRQTIEAALVTIQTQVQVARWEHAVYVRRAQGRLPADELGDMWLAGRQALHGPDIRQAEGVGAKIRWPGSPLFREDYLAG